MSFDDSEDNSICQNPELASNFEKCLAFPIWARTWSTEGRICLSLFTWFNFVRSTLVIRLGNYNHTHKPVNSVAPFNQTQPVKQFRKTCYNLFLVANRSPWKNTQLERATPTRLIQSGKARHSVGVTILGLLWMRKRVPRGHAFHKCNFKMAAGSFLYISCIPSTQSNKREWWGSVSSINKSINSLRLGKCLNCSVLYRILTASLGTSSWSSLLIELTNSLLFCAGSVHFFLILWAMLYRVSVQGVWPHVCINSPKIVTPTECLALPDSINRMGVARSNCVFFHGLLLLTTVSISDKRFKFLITGLPANCDRTLLPHELCLLIQDRPFRW